MERANECLDEAIILAETNLWNSVPDRLYHACFYAVAALIIKHDIVTSSQTGIKDAFLKEFVSPGSFDKEMGDLYTELFDRRANHHSHDSVRISPLIAQTKHFLQTVKTKL